MSEQKTFEQNMEALEQIIFRLESGNEPLDRMIALYEEGAAYYQACQEELQAYEARIKARKEQMQ